MSSNLKIRTGPLPSYKQPPVDEVACGIRFEPLPQLKVPHIGVLWEKFRQEYPVTQHATPISTDTSLLVDETTGVPLPRVWFISKGDNELVQFQLDRFYYNWRCRAGVYPRYPFVIEKFETAKRRLDELTEELQLGAIKTVECELTYINHIPKGQGWETIEDLPMLMHDFMWQQQKHSFLPTPANLAWQTRFPLPDDNGWLNVKLNQAKRKVDGLPLLILEVAANGLGKDTTATGLRNWFDLAHEWIVCGFADLTTKEAQETIWERET